MEAHSQSREDARAAYEARLKAAIEKGKDRLRDPALQDAIGELGVLLRTRADMKGSDACERDMVAAVAAADKHIFEQSTAFQKLVDWVTTGGKSTKSPRSLSIDHPR